MRLAGSPQVLASALVKADQTDAQANGGYNYAPLEQPFVLEPQTEYYVASYETGPTEAYLSGGTVNYNANSGTNTDAQKLMGYPGRAPEGVNANGNFVTSSNFRVDASQSWRINTTIGPNIGCRETCGAATYAGLVNIKVQ